MKKSELYYTALVCVMEARLDPKTKLEVIDLLLNDKGVAEFVERREEEEK